MKIAHKLWLLLSLMVAIVGAVGLHAALVSTEGLRTSTQQGAISEAQTLIESIDHLVEAEIRQWDAYAQSDAIRKALQRSNERFAAFDNVDFVINERDARWREHSPGEPTAAMREVDAAALSLEFRDHLNVMSKGLSYRPVAEVFVTNCYGANIAQSATTSDYRQSDEPWWQIAMRDGRYVGDVELDESSGQYAMDVCLRIDDESSRPLGVMKVVLNVRQALDVIQRKRDLNETNTKSWTIVNRDAVVLASTRQDMICQELSLRHPAFVSRKPSGNQLCFDHDLFDDHDGTLCAVAAAPASGRLGELGWRAVIEQDKSAALAPARKMASQMLACAAVASLVALLLGIGVSMTMAKRTRKMLRGVQEFAAGNFDHQIDARGRDECAAIARGLNEMASSLREAHEQLTQQAGELEKKNAILAAEILERERTESELLSLTHSLQAANAELDQMLASAADQGAALMQAKSAAEAANRTKSEFLSNMSHELRTPLTAILGFTETLLSEGNIENAPPERIEALQTILRNGEHLLQLINDVLDISKIEAGRMDVESITCSPLAIARQAVDAMQFKAQANDLALSLRCDTPVPSEIISDPTRIKQILINLISNAVKFTDHGSVDVHIAFLEKNGNGTLAFAVRDTGIGMTAEQIDKLFRPFTQADTSTSRNFGGTGLGLTITKRLVEMLGGEISVDSKEGEGSTFSFTINAADVSQATMITLADLNTSARAELKQKAADGPVLNCRVLLAEDGPDNQRLISFVLQKAGAEVTVVENGQLAYESAMEALARGTPFDVILMDMQMPVLDGYGATTKLRESGYELPIIAATAHALTGEREKCLAAGCDDYTTKPINRVELIEKVAQWAESSAESTVQPTT